MLYRRFVRQQESFTHVMILDHLNRLSKDISETFNSIQKANKINEQLQLEGLLIEYCKTIVRFLTSLQGYKMFA